MITAIQNSPVNTPKPQYNISFGAHKTNKLIKAGEKQIGNANSTRSIPNTLEKFILWLVGFKG